MATTSALKSLRDRLSSPVQNNQFSLAGENINSCISSYLLHKKNITRSRKLLICRVRDIINELNSDIEPIRIDEDFNEDFIFYMIDDNEGVGLRPNTAEGYLRALIAVLTWAGKHGAELSDSYEKVPNIPYEPKRICPTLSEINHIYFFDIDTLPYRKDCKDTLKKVRDTYVLNAICYGLRYSDIKRIDENCFKGDELTMLQQKTGRVVHNDGTMVLSKQIKRELLAKYPNMEAPYRGSIGNYNCYLKKLLQHMHGSFDKIEVFEYKIGNHVYHVEKPRWKCFASHSSRRGYITNNLRVYKQNITDVQHAVGHSSSNMTDKYIVLDNE